MSSNAISNQTQPTATSNNSQIMDSNNINSTGQQPNTANQSQVKLNSTKLKEKRMI